jgi:hypothetical protein
MKRAVFTICCNNYLGYANTLLQSILRQGDSVDLYLVLCERASERIGGIISGVKVLFVSELEIDCLNKISFAFDILELNTAVKPSVFRYLFRNGYQEAMYFDPDIAVYSSVIQLFPDRTGSTVSVTPHTLTPINDKRYPGEQTILQAGIFNLGFIAIKNNSEGLKFVSWWENRCLRMGFNDKSEGLFVDQKFCDFIPAFLERVNIIRNPGCNVAYWNLHERFLVSRLGKNVINDEYDLVFFHFSGIEIPTSNQISKYCKGVTLGDRPDLKQIFDEYRLVVNKNGYEKYSNLPYSFGSFGGVKAISKMERLLFLTTKNNNQYTIDSIFSQKSGARKWFCRPVKLKTKQVEIAAAGQSKLNAFALRILRIVLKTVCFCLGESRYLFWLKVMHKISSPRIHANLLGEDQWISREPVDASAFLSTNNN